MTTPLCYTVIIPFFIALFLVGWIHPKLVKIALLKNIVDNPDARKLQRTPVPVLGGVAVFFGVAHDIFFVKTHNVEFSFQYVGYFPDFVFVVAGNK